jgi:hypothetical protein
MQASPSHWLHETFNAKALHHHFWPGLMAGAELSDISEIRKVTQSSPCLWAYFRALTPLSVVSVKYGNFIKSGYEMLKLNI